jgi:cellulose biosynthesis protein BcsQ
VRVTSLCAIKGGVGKTTAAVNLAALMAGRGQRVLLWDLDPQGAATYTLGVGTRVLGGGRRLFSSKQPLTEHAAECSVEGLRVVPADFSLRYLDVELSGLKRPRRRILRLLETAEDDFDHVVLDCPPGISLVVDAALRGTDVGLVPIIPAALPLRSYEQLAAYLRGDDRLRRVQLVGFLSMVDRRKRMHRDLATDLPTTGDHVLGAVIPASVDVENMAVHRRPTVCMRPGSPAAAAYRDLLAELDELHR